ncbi:MAG: hypothetical protein KA792_08425, partial [Bacteroidales bacterium]|nr:hypothetical protein [Bacteroidales bacterium]
IILLFPTIIKLEHHHEHFVCSAKNEKHFHNEHHKCIVCSFEYSLFIDYSSFKATEKNYFNDIFSNFYLASFYSNNAKNNVLLRAPPQE